MKIAGFDIGGANTDLAVIDFEEGDIKNIEVDFEYLPMWSNNDDLSQVLIELIEKICPVSEIDAVGISMTAELVDAYDTKKDGVLDVVRKCEETFDCPIIIGNSLFKFSELVIFSITLVKSLIKFPINPIPIPTINPIITIIKEVKYIWHKFHLMQLFISLSFLKNLEQKKIASTRTIIAQ